MPKPKPQSKLPPKLEAFAWNIPRPMTEWGRAAVALEALETASTKIWNLVPAGWFNLGFARRHGRPGTKRIIAIMEAQAGKPMPRNTAKTRP